MGFLMTFKSFTEDSAAVMLYLCSSCTINPDRKTPFLKRHLKTDWIAQSEDVLKHALF
jgi:hypothetical protein